MSLVSLNSNLWNGNKSSTSQALNKFDRYKYNQIKLKPTIANKHFLVQMKPHCKIKVFSAQMLINVIVSSVLKENNPPTFHCWRFFFFVLEQVKPYTGEDAKYKAVIWILNTCKVQEWWFCHDLLYTKEQICRGAGKPPTEIYILYPYFSSWRFVLLSIKAQRLVSMNIFL